MELRHLRYFIAVGEAENVSRAALTLHVSQPAVSRQVRDLEAELGFPLLERTARSVRLTESGRIFLIEARAVLQRVDEADRAYRESMERLPGLEAVARYAAFLRGIGRNGEARELIADIERRTSSTQGPFRREAQAWLDLAERG